MSLSDGLTSTQRFASAENAMSTIVQSD